VARATRVDCSRYVWCGTHIPSQVLSLAHRPFGMLVSLLNFFSYITIKHIASKKLSVMAVYMMMQMRRVVHNYLPTNLYESCWNVIRPVGNFNFF